MLFEPVTIDRIPRVELAEKVERLRGKMTNLELAAACKCSAGNIHKITREGSQPSLAIGVRLARALGVPAEWLGDDEQGWPPPVSLADRAVELVKAALVGGGLAGELTSAERRLLASFRRCSPGQQRYIMGTVDAAANLPGADDERGDKP